MLALLGILPSFFTTVNGITGAITNERIKMAENQTEAQRIESQERINSLQAKRDVLIAESGSSKINAYIRASIGLGVSFILNKIFIWDKALGDYTGGHTDGLDANLWGVITAVIGFYFLYEATTATARILKS